MHRLIPKALPSLAAACALLSAAPLHAAVVNVSWTGGGDGASWSDAGNWNPAVAPDNGADSYRVAIAGAAAVTVDGSFAIDALDLGATATLLIPAAGELNLAGDSTIDGLLSLADSDPALGNRAVLGVQTLTLSGTGTVQAQTSNFQNVIVDTGSGSTLTVGAGLTLAAASGATLRSTVDTVLEGTGEAGDGRIVFDSTLTNNGSLTAGTGTIRIGPGNELSGSGVTTLQGPGSILELASGVTGHRLAGAGTVALDGAATAFDDVVLDGVTVIVEESEQLVLSTGLVNDGTIRIADSDPDVGNRAVLAVDGAVTLSGTGQVLFASSAFQNVVEPATGGGSLTIGSGQQVLTAPGAEGRFTVATVLDGTMTAQDGRIVLDRDVTNNGTITVSNGSLRVGPATELSGSGATVILAAGSTLDLAGTISGETIEGRGTITVDGAAPAFDNVTLDGVTVVIGAGETLTLSNGLVNGGIIRLADLDPDLGNRAVLSIAGALAIDGTGQIVFDSPEFQNVLEPAGGVGSLTLGSGQSVLATAGAEGRFIVATDNEGAITAVDGRIVLDADVTNSGVITASAGTVRVGPGHTLTNTVDGLIAGDGLFEIVAPGPFLNSGSIAPGPGVAELTVDGDVTFEPGSRFLVDLTSGASDLLTVTGATALQGDLVLSQPDGMPPGASEVYEPLVTGSLSGVFDNAAPTGGGEGTVTAPLGTFRVLYAATRVTLTGFMAASGRLASPIPTLPPVLVGMLALLLAATVFRLLPTRSRC